eukprot:983077-Prymnesium_polylepis.1
MGRALDDVEKWADRTTVGKDGNVYTNYERLNFIVHDGCSEKSIYVGVCGGNKQQKPLSTLGSTIHRNGTLVSRWRARLS